MAVDPQTQISNHLLATKSLPIAQHWLSQFVSGQRAATTPLSALTQTALFRILASDFTSSLEITNPSQALPENIPDPAVKERLIPGPIPLQILDIEDIGTSLWSQVESIEKIERGEETRGREIIRTVTRDESGDAAPASQSNNTNNPQNIPGTNNSNARNIPSSTTSNGGPHRLVLQDAKGTRVVAIECRPVEGVGIGKTSIGAKMVVKNATVARGMLLLEPDCVTVLGGKIEALDKAWKDGRKARLLERLAEQAAAEAT
ncbi:RecQ-mediated genome instability protein 1 [Blastomyces parvus]|uniref:RecQ-mediated genome instability protein 1 n=1 Tax=Blastomyces parvus TaxID=2060905 RepID=A0A2B7X321_9EURO|nr:RecQ-mediated genome instability protein 1 [Blastomyces parvus]